MQNQGLNEITQLLALLILFAVVWGNWNEAKHMSGNKKGIMLMFWFLVVNFDDFVAAGLILAILRIASGGNIESIFMAAPWLGMTFLILRSSQGGVNWTALLTKLADDIRDGSLIVFVLVYWLGWGSMLIPQINLSM